MKTYPIENPAADWPADEYSQHGNYMSVQDMQNDIEYGFIIPNEDGLIRRVIIKDGFICEADGMSDDDKLLYPTIAYAFYGK